MPGTAAVLSEPDPSLLPMPSCHNTSLHPIKLAVCTPTPARALHSEPRGDQGRLGDTMPPPTSSSGSAANWRGIPSPYLFCTHSAIYSLWQHSNHKALCLLPGMGLLPTPTEPGPQAQQAPPTLAHCPFLQERKLSTPPPKTLGQGAGSTPKHQPTQPLASKGTRYPSSSVSNGQSLSSKGATPWWKEVPSVPQALRAEKPRSWTHTTTKKTYSGSTQNPHSRRWMKLHGPAVILEVCFPGQSALDALGLFQW